MVKRIKLKVCRNKLPDIDILWPVKEQEGKEKFTIAKLIAEVDDRIPLESGDWTLDQYVCEVEGFECLHYQFVFEVLKDGDNVTIRPLATSDVKARRQGGRTQITGEGFHILDGVPYGMQPNQRPLRPGVLIPSRKRRRPEFEEEGEENQADLTIADIEENPELLEDVNMGVGSGLKFMGVDEADDEDEIGPERAGGPPKKKQKKDAHVHFKIVKDIPGFSIEGDEDEDEEDDEDFDPDGGGSGSEEADKDDDVDSDSDSSSDVSSDSDSDSDSGSDSSESNSDSSSDSDSDASSAPEEQSSKAPAANAKMNGTAPTLSSTTAQPQAAPHTGKPRTKERNKRRQTRKKILRLVRDIIGAQATPGECDAWMAENPEKTAYLKLAAEDNLNHEGDGPTTDDEDEEMGATEPGNGQLRGGACEAEEEFNGFSTGAANSAVDEDEELLDASHLVNGESRESPPRASNSSATKSKSAKFEKQRKDLLDAIKSGGVVADSTSPISIADVEKAAAEAETIMSTPSGSKRGSPAVENSESKRVRLNLDGSRRAIFSALGQRTPKTAQDAERVRNRLASGHAAKGKSKARAAEEEVPEEDPYSDAWRSKIRLMAVDCDDPSIQLSEPPYPFKQRWDPSQQRDNGWWQNGGKKRKRKARNSYGQNAGDGYEDESYLDYGEEEEEQGDETWPDADADAEEEEYGGGDELAELVDQQIRSDEASKTPQKTILDDLPSLPADLSTLRDLKQEDCLPGAIIAYRQLDMSAATNWQPVLSPHRTAKITSDSSGGYIYAELAARDRDVKNTKVDADGKRVYEKFEMNAGSDDEDEEDDGYRELLLSELQEAKLVRAASGEEYMKKAKLEAEKAASEPEVPMAPKH